MKTSMLLRVAVFMTMFSVFTSCGETENTAVQTYILNISDETEVDVSVSVPLPELTQEVIDNDLIEGYIKFKGDSYLYGISRGTIIAPGNPEPFSISVSMRPGHYALLFRNADGEEFNINSGQLDLVKLVIIKSTNSTTRTVIGNL